MKKLFKDLEGHGYGQGSVVMPVVQDDKTDLERRLTVVQALSGVAASPAEPRVELLVAKPLVLVPECGLGTLPSPAAVGGNPSDLSYQAPVESELASQRHQSRELSVAQEFPASFVAFVEVSERVMSLAWKYFKRTLLGILVLFLLYNVIFIARAINAGNIRKIPWFYTEAAPLIYGGFNCGWNASSSIDVYTCKMPPQSKSIKFNKGNLK